MNASREMTLKEYVEQLPKDHCARRQFDKLVDYVVGEAILDLFDACGQHDPYLDAIEDDGAEQDRRNAAKSSLADAVRKARGGDPPVPFKGFA